MTKSVNLSSMCDIDMVYTYCDGTEETFQKRKKEFCNDSDLSINPSIRFENINELNWSIRTVLKFIPFIRNIFIVTDRQTPFLDEEIQLSGKIRMIDHSEIIPIGMIPVFYSDVIESYLHRIPGLSEIFLYNNDDCFHMKPISFDDIIEPYLEQSIDDLSHHVKLKIISNVNWDNMKKKQSEYARRIFYTIDILYSHNVPNQDRDNSNSNSFINNHCTKILRKSTLEWIENEYKEELDHLRSHRFRTLETIQYMFLALNVEQFLHQNTILSKEEGDVVEYHFGNSDVKDEYKSRFDENKR